MHFVCTKERTQVHLLTSLRSTCAWWPAQAPPGYSYCCREELGSVHCATVHIRQYFCCRGHLADLLPRPTVTRFLRPLSDTISIVSFRNPVAGSLLSSSRTKHFTNNSLVKWLQKVRAAVTSCKASPVRMSMLPLFFHFVFGIGMEPCWQTTNNSKGNKCQSQQVAGTSLTLTPIQRLMQEKGAGLSPQQTTRVSKGFSIPLFSFPDVSGHRRAWLMTCFIDVLQYLPYPTTRDGCVINPNAETGWNSLQEWRVSDNGSPRAEHSGNTLHKFWPCKFSLWSQKLVPLFSSLIYAVELHKKFRWPQPFIRA